MQNAKRTIDVHILTGFLGSGKTTLLTRLLQHYESQGRKAAVVMNELGDVNLDGLAVESDVPMAELLGGCICCSIRGDLSLELKMLIDQHAPDVVIIEATGAANPFEMIDGVTETSMYAPIELKSIIAVVDGPELLARSRSGGQTFKLMKEQICCASQLLLNKVDRLEGDERMQAEQLMRETNGYAPIVATVRCAVDEQWLDVIVNGDGGKVHAAAHESGADAESHTHSHDCRPDCDHDHHHHVHESHAHVMSLTHFLERPVDSHAFEAFLRALPDNVYRAKGVVTFRDSETASRFLFQYAYKETDFIRINPQGKVNDVAVFIGEHFSREAVLRQLTALEQAE
ncbi:G3E family GTPase [Paenibacillus cellulosilyticus]|uniref:G3E family GTPase n=1 Tax=Paenibacillus cellulosilyticus TaxID=375489 RepID=A0A2V2YMJ6_9BACL|nr:GTP-binding protein [Paenibacillus cellulosilyticus]PWV95561.1 G3E family GTPase [Paenibacillus cellulosilyticus]QKS47362.1 GTP-binding protein [Paenibacillus cellulosilyticus]